MYAYVSGRPTVFIDPDGRAGKPAGLHVLTMDPLCTFGMGYGVNRYFRPNEDNNKYAHCLASCLIDNVCQGGRVSAHIAERGKESLDWARCKLTGRKASCDSAFEPDDFVDNAYGRSCPTNQSCFVWCDKLKNVKDRR
jgi:hypothetical protein